MQAGENSQAATKAPFWFIAIGASGSEGVKDVTTLLAALPFPFTAVVLIVLHRPTDRISYLRDILARASRLPVVIAGTGERFEVGVCYIGEPAEHLTLAAKGFAHLVEGFRDQYRNRTVDILFRSIAAFAGSRGIGVVLSGALDDGARGLVAIKEAGGFAMVLRPTGQRQGMPENAIAYDGPVDFIGSAQSIADEISRLVMNS